MTPNNNLSSVSASFDCYRSTTSSKTGTCPSLAVWWEIHLGSARRRLCMRQSHRQLASARALQGRFVAAIANILIDRADGLCRNGRVRAQPRSAKPCCLSTRSFLPLRFLSVSTVPAGVAWRQSPPCRHLMCLLCCLRLVSDRCDGVSEVRSVCGVSRLSHPPHVLPIRNGVANDNSLSLSLSLFLSIGVCVLWLYVYRIFFSLEKL